MWSVIHMISSSQVSRLPLTHAHILSIHVPIVQYACGTARFDIKKYWLYTCYAGRQAIELPFYSSAFRHWWFISGVSRDWSFVRVSAFQNRALDAEQMRFYCVQNLIDADECFTDFPHSVHGPGSSTVDYGRWSRQISWKFTTEIRSHAIFTK